MKRPSRPRIAAPIAALSLLAVLQSTLIAEAIAEERSRVPNTKIVRVGVLWPSTASHKALRPRLETALREVGYSVGENTVLEHRVPAKREGIEESAADLIDARCDVLLAIGTPAAVSLKHRTSETPVIFFDVADPVAAGLVKELSKPGTNVTGFSALAPEMSVKLAELAKEALPALLRIGVLWDRANPGNADQIEQLMKAAPSLKLDVYPVGIRTDADFDNALDAARKRNVGAVVVLRSSTNIENARRIGALATTRHLPAIGAFPQLVEQGGLIAYYPSFDEMWTGVAQYVSQVLGGARPETLPVQQPSRFELIINVKAARTLGVAIPESLSLRADRVIK